MPFLKYDAVFGAPGEHLFLRLNRESAPYCAATSLPLGAGLSIWLRWGIAVLASWLTVALFSELVRFVPLIREFLGIRAQGGVEAQVGVQTSQETQAFAEPAW